MRVVSSISQPKKRPKACAKGSVLAYERALCLGCKVVLNRTGLWSDGLYNELEQHIHDMLKKEDGEISLFLNLSPSVLSLGRERLRVRPDLRYVINELGGLSEEVVLWVLGRGEESSYHY